MNAIRTFYPACKAGRIPGTGLQSGRVQKGAGNGQETHSDSSAWKRVGISRIVAYVKPESVGKLYTLLKIKLQESRKSLYFMLLALLARRLYNLTRSLKHGRPVRGPAGPVNAFR